MTLQRKVLNLTDAAMAEDGAGSFSGYGSLWDILDDQGDIVVRGAYADTLPRFRERGFISWGHDWNTPVATIREAHEDDIGLRITADFHSDDVSQRARRITQERLARGKHMGLSIGYRTVEDEMTETARLLKKVELFETSLVTVPALADAGVTDAKAAMPPADWLTSAEAWLALERDLKSGQPQLSAARRERLCALSEQMAGLVAEIDALLAEATPKPRDEEADADAAKAGRRRWLESQRILARLHGAAV